MTHRLAYLLILSLVLFASCTKEPRAWDGPFIELSVLCDDTRMTKAENEDEQTTRDGVGGIYHENLIDWVDFFIYPGDNPSPDANATYHIRCNSGKNRSDVFHIELTSADINEKIFPIGANYEIVKSTVFAIVNYPGILVEDEEDLNQTSLSVLEALRVTTDFVSPANHNQSRFMMSGKTVITLNGRDQVMAANGDPIELTRYACKLTMGLKVADRIELPNGEVWHPMLEGMEVYLVNGVNSVRISGEDLTPSYFSYSSNRKKYFTKDADGNLVQLLEKTDGYYNTYPMYMYPQHWTYGATEGTDKEPYLKLVIPWARLEENDFLPTQRQYYYKILMPEDQREEYLRRFVRNNWYHLDVEVEMLGSETDEATVTVSPISCYIVYWQDIGMVFKDAEIGNARYLSVSQDRYTLYNTNSVSIRYTTSHPVVIQDVKATCPYYGEATSGTARGGAITCNTGDNFIDLYPEGSYYLDYNLAARKALNEGVDWLTDIGTAIFFSHPINNNYKDPKFDYSPFTVSFTIAHEGTDDDRYRERITLVQTPAIYISSLPNSDDTFVRTRPLNSNDQYVYHSEHWGYVYVDGRQIVRANAEKDAQGVWVETPAWNGSINNTYMDYFRSQYPDDPAVQAFNAEDFHWRVVWYTGGGRDIFRINVTVLPEDSDLVIGDPRADEVDNLNLAFREGDTVDGGFRSLQYYYPAEKSDRTANMLAPSFRISTKCGGTEFGNLSEQQAKWRCASYQEDGFPGGRWRLPTKGEIKFMAQLSANGAFARLFSASGDYWSANGAIKVNNSSVTDVTTDKAMTRCVYDVWYWGDEQTNHPDDGRAHFYWGDRPR